MSSTPKTSKKTDAQLDRLAKTAKFQDLIDEIDSVVDEIAMHSIDWDRDSARRAAFKGYENAMCRSLEIVEKYVSDYKADGEEIWAQAAEVIREEFLDICDLLAKTRDKRQE